MRTSNTGHACYEPSTNMWYAIKEQSEELDYAYVDSGVIQETSSDSMDYKWRGISTYVMSY